MRDFTDYKRRKIARFYQSCEDTGKTIKYFDITYKELYKIISHTRFLSKKIIKGEKYKVCPSCNNLQKLCIDNFYYRKGTKYFQSYCKSCMKTLSKIYKIDNKEKINSRRREWFKKYYSKNKEKIKNRYKGYYIKHRRILQIKRGRNYKRNKARFLKRIFHKK